MAEFILEEVEQFVTIPDGEILAAEVVSCVERESIFDDDRNPGQKKREVNFKFRVVEDGEYQGRFLFASTPTTFSSHPDCKLRVWVQELLGQDDLPIGFKFNTESVEGAPCRVAVGARERKGADGTPVIKNFVADVIRASSVKSAEDIF